MYGLDEYYAELGVVRRWISRYSEGQSGLTLNHYNSRSYITLLLMLPPPTAQGSGKRQLRHRTGSGYRLQASVGSGH